MNILKLLAVLFFSFLLIFVGTTLGVVLKQESIVSHEDRIVSVSEEASLSVVSIIASKDMSEFFRGGAERRLDIGGGSGFVFSEDGLILTNRHVIRDEDAQYMVFTQDGREFSAEIFAIDPVRDLAVLKIENSDLPVVSLGDSSDLRVGQTAIAIGNALGELRNTVSVGVVSGLSRDVFATDGIKTVSLDNVIQTDAGINRGNSGGPLLNLDGEVIGINTAMAIGAQNIGFAIPIEDAMRAIRGAKEEGEIVYPFLGIRYVMVDEEKDVDVSHGALIVKGGFGEPAIEPGSAAEEVGLKEGDVILKLNQTRIDEDNHLARAITNYDPGEKVSLTVFRDGEEIVIDVVLGERRY